MTRLALAASLAAVSLLASCEPAASDNDPSPAPNAAGETAISGVGRVAPPDPSANAATGATAAPVQDDADTADACGASKVEPWIGKEATVPVRAEVAKAAGAASDRWIYPDSVVTQDFRPDRLNVVMEKGTDRIMSARCG